MDHKIQHFGLRVADDLMYNPQRFEPQLPIHWANNIIIDFWVINSTFLSITCRVVVPVIDLSSPHTKISNNINHNHKTHKRAPRTTELGYPPW